MNDHSELVGDMAELVMEFQARISKTFIKLLQKVLQLKHETINVKNITQCFFYA